MNIKEFIYQNSPVALQNYLCSIIGKRYLAERYNDVFFQLLGDLNKSQYASENEIVSYKEEHIFKMLKYSYENVPYYRKSFSELK